MTWAVVKYKKNQLLDLKKDIKKKLGENIKFYFPKIKYSLIKKNKKVFREENLLDDYIFIQHEKLINTNNLKSIEYCKGLKMILKNFLSNQKNISDFIEECKNHEKDGSISNSFIKNLKNSNFIFLTGPFYKKIFKIINRKKNFLGVSINNFNLRINSKNLIFKNI